MTASTLTSDNGASSGTSGIKYNGGTDGTLQIQTTTSGGTATTAVTIDNSQNTTLAGYLNAPNTFGFKNRIINGAMMISQRGTSFSTPAAGTYNLDRWFVGWGGASPASVAQVSGPTGFKNAVQITGGASNTLTQLIQRIESLNCTDLSGQTVTFQANIATSSNQTVLWVLKYPAVQDNFASVTTITSGTWSTTSTATTFTATVSGLPSGVLNGLQVEIYPNNAGAFTSGTITITGVQLEKGSTATSFDYRSIGTELMLCQRYYYKNTGGSGTVLMAGGYAYSSTNASQSLGNLPVTMRTSPTSTYSGISFQTVSGNWAITSIAATQNTATQASLSFAASTGSMSNGQFAQVYSPSSGYIDFSAEL